MPYGVEVAPKGSGLPGWRWGFLVRMVMRLVSASRGGGGGKVMRDGGKISYMRVGVEAESDFECRGGGMQ